MKIKKSEITVNDIYCNAYSIKLNKKEEISSYDLFKKIESKLPTDEVIIFSDFEGINFREIIPEESYKIFTKKKEIIEKELKIKNLLIKNGFKFYDENDKFNSTVQFNKDWIELEFRNEPGKQTIDKLSKIFKIEDWCFDFNDWYGTIKLLLKGELL